MSGRMDREKAHFRRVFLEQLDRGQLRIPDEKLRHYCSCTVDSACGKDVLFALARPLKGCNVLEMGCGSGLDTVVLAAGGACVWAYDICPEAIEVADQRVRLHGLGDPVHFAVASEPKEAFPGRRFNIVFGDSILHHLDPASLGRLGRELREILEPGGCCVFREPVIRRPILRRLRGLIRWSPSDPSPDEAPLSETDLRTVCGPFANCIIRYFEFLARLHFFVKDPRLAGRLRSCDRWLFDHWPPLQVLASEAVMKLGT